MVTRKRRAPSRYEGGGDETVSEPVEGRRESVRRMSVQRMPIRSDIAIDRVPEDVPMNGGRRPDRESRRDTPARRGIVRSENASPSERERAILDVSVDAKSGKTTGENTPVRAANGSVSAASAVSRNKINTRSKGSTHSTSSDTSDHEDLLIESLPQLTSLLKEAQARASSLSTNFTRLMRLFLDEELDIVDKEIAQVKNGSDQGLKNKYRDLLADFEEKKRVAQARRTKSKHEINLRFAVTIDAQWSRFRADKKHLRGKMCRSLASRISHLQSENDEARLVSVGVRPSSTLQQAPWWIKMPKQFTWLNLPDGVNKAQREKDLEEMGLLRKRPVLDLGLRTPSPEGCRKKRKRKERDEEHEVDSALDFEDTYPHLWGGPWTVPPPNVNGTTHMESGTESMNSLLEVVEGDMHMQYLAPRQVSTTQPEMANPASAQYRTEYRPPLLPRPTMMPPDNLIASNRLMSHSVPYIPSKPPPILPALRLPTGGLVSDRRPSNINLPQPPEVNEPFLPISHSQPIVSPKPSDHKVDPPHPIAIAPRPESAPTPPRIDPHLPIQPYPTAKLLTSSSQDINRQKRPPSLLPKSNASQSLEIAPPFRSDDDRPAKERFPLRRTSAPQVPTACAPPPAPAMGRFVHNNAPENVGFMQFPPNPKLPIPRLPSQITHDVPLRIAPKPVDYGNGISERKRENT